MSRKFKASEIAFAWAGVLQGRRPILSLEITKECPLRCPGCYAYGLGHLGDAGPLVQMHDLKGDALVAGVLELVHRLRPLHISIVGGEPLVRFRELDILLPKLAGLGVHIQLVTSAVRPIPVWWKDLSRLFVVVSIDGLQPEHDRRRAPATYDRILKHIAGHHITVHCTITRQLLQRPGYLRDFVSFWSIREEIHHIWFSLYTPQKGEDSEERLTAQDRENAVAELARLRTQFRKVDVPETVLRGFLRPPASPEECLFAQTTTCISADLATRITPCQFGGQPVCSECGCMASAGLAAVGKYKIAGLVPAFNLFSLSKRMGDRISRSVSEGSTA